MKVEIMKRMAASALALLLAATLLAFPVPAEAQQIGDSVPESALHGPTYALPQPDAPASGPQTSGSQAVGPQAPSSQAPNDIAPQPMPQQQSYAPPPYAPRQPYAPPPMAYPGRPLPGDNVFEAYVAALQRALPAHGYRVGPPTGRLDQVTEAAILTYQQDAGLPQNARDIIALKVTLDHVTFTRPAVVRRNHPGMAVGAMPEGTNPAGAMTPPIPLGPPSASSAPQPSNPPEYVPPQPAQAEPAAVPAGSMSDPLTVRHVQQALKNKGYDIEVNGNLDIYTVNAIKVFQASNGLPRDGKIDQYLLDLLKQKT